MFKPTGAGASTGMCQDKRPLAIVCVLSLVFFYALYTSPANQRPATAVPASGPDTVVVSPATVSPFAVDVTAFSADRGGVRVGMLREAPQYKMSVPLGTAQSWWDVNAQGEFTQGDVLHYYRAYWPFVKDLPKDSVVLDVGANLGLSLCPMASAGVTVVAFEPVTRNVRKLRQTVLVNGYERVAVVHAAVGAVASTVKIYAPLDREDNTSLNPTVANANVKGQLQEETVALVTIDGWLGAHAAYVDSSKVRFIKADVQGFELGVLKGAERLLRANRDRGLTIQAEFGPDMIVKGGGRPIELLEFMDSLGYKAVSSESGRTIPPSDFAAVAQRSGQDDLLFSAK